MTDTTVEATPFAMQPYRDAAGSAEHIKFLQAQIDYLSNRLHDVSTENLMLKQALATMAEDRDPTEGSQADADADQTRDTDPAT